MNYQQMASHWREHQATHASDEQRQHAETRRRSGIVMIWHNSVRGWHQELRDASRVRPNTVAVAHDGSMHVARGGNDWDGARRWVSVL